MPDALLKRLRPNCIREFRLAAEQRAIDASVLSEAGRRTGAIYLWGYCAEMILKAAYFEVRNFTLIQPITFGDLQSAKNSATGYGVAKFENYHDLRGWAELLVEHRTHIPQLRYPSPVFASQVVGYGSKAYSLWRESLRYHDNMAYMYEAKQMKTAVEWLMTNSPNL